MSDPLDKKENPDPVDSATLDDVHLDEAEVGEFVNLLDKKMDNFGTQENTIKRNGTTKRTNT